MRRLALALIVSVFILNSTQTVSFNFNKTKNQITVVYRESSNFWVPSVGPIAKVWKEIYGVENGRIILLRTIQGRHVPAYQVEERLEFEE